MCVCVCECDAREFVYVSVSRVYALYSFDTYFSNFTIVGVLPSLPSLISWVYVFSTCFVQKAYLSYDALRFNAHPDTSHFALHCWLSIQNSIKCYWILFSFLPFFITILPSFTKSGIRRNRNRGSVFECMNESSEYPFAFSRTNLSLAWKCQNVLPCYFFLFISSFFIACGEYKHTWIHKM